MFVELSDSLLCNLSLLEQQQIIIAKNNLLMGIVIISLDGMIIISL